MYHIKQLQQDRHVAEELNVTHAQPAHQRIARKAAYADQGANDGCEKMPSTATRSVLVKPTRKARQ
jgi:hypothetical protein